MDPPAVVSPVLLHQQRDPPRFHGLPHEDAEDWLDQFDRVATFNAWDANSKIRNVYFALEDSARTWYVNHECGLRTWDTFKTQFLQAFTSTFRKEKADILLQNRIHLPNQSVMVYVELMKLLFRRTNPSMSEETKAWFLMKGVKKQLFAGLVRSPPSTVDDFVKEATSIEKSLNMRARQYVCMTASMLSAGTEGSTTTSADSQRELIRAVVCEELAKLLPTLLRPQIASFTDVVRDEVKKTLDSPTFGTK